MKGIRNLAAILTMMVSQPVFTQGLQLELMAGHQGIYYQHNTGFQLDERSQLGILNISSVTARYAKFHRPELMSQVYLTRPVIKGYQFGVGGIYVSEVGVRPSAMLNIYEKAKDFSIVIFPRVDIWKNPSMELMIIMEYRPKINTDLALYSRIQLQAIWDKSHHLKSSQHFRLGLDHLRLQFGLAAVLDQYGLLFTKYSNYGFFIRKEFQNFPKPKY